MATEAQKLIGISLTKIAQSRMNRGGISLHKNLLVATVLQKARYIFMEEAYAASYVCEFMTPAPGETKRCADEADTRLQTPMPVLPRAERDELNRRAHKRRLDVEGEETFIKRSCGDERLHASEDEAIERLDTASSSDDSDPEDSEEPMEVDTITSLVSVFSFGATAGIEPHAKLGRSVSTPDFCSAQAKEMESIQQRTAVAMTV